MLHPDVQPAPSATHGIGLRATTAIPAGTAIWFPCRKCPAWAPDETPLLPPAVLERLDTWGHTLANGDLLVPCSGACFMNHSCAANVLDVGLDFGVAVTDIQAGTELTCDYGAFFGDGGWSMSCDCGQAGCRGVVSTDDYRNPRLQGVWSTRIDRVLGRLQTVPQPLSELLAAASATYRGLRDGSGTVAPIGTGDSIVRPGFLAESS